MFFYVLLVVGPLLQPDVGDGLAKGRVRAGAGGNPLVRLLHRGKVVEGVDIDELHTHILQPVPPHGGLVGGVSAPGAVGIVGPHDHGFHVLQGVLQEVEGLGSPQPPIIAVSVGGPPGKTLPGVRVVQNLRVAQHPEKTRKGAQLVPHQAPAVVRAGDGRHRLLAVGTLDPGDFPGHQAQGLVPGGAAITGLSSVVRVPPFSVRGFHKILPDHGITEPVVGVRAVFFRQGDKRGRGFAIWGVFLSSGFDDPPRRVVFIENDRPDPSNHTVFRVNRHGAADADTVGYFFRHCAPSLSCFHPPVFIPLFPSFDPRNPRRGEF